MVGSSGDQPPSLGELGGFQKSLINIIKIHLYDAHHLGNSKGFRSSVPKTKTKYVFLIINHNITPTFWKLPHTTRDALRCGPYTERGEFTHFPFDKTHLLSSCPEDISSLDHGAHEHTLGIGIGGNQGWWKQHGGGQVKVVRFFSCAYRGPTDGFREGE